MAGLDLDDGGNLKACYSPVFKNLYVIARVFRINSIITSIYFD